MAGRIKSAIFDPAGLSSQLNIVRDCESSLEKEFAIAERESK